MISGVKKAHALRQAIEEGVNHMCTVSAFQQHPHTTFVVDEDATMELRVRTVKYFQGLMDVHNKLVEDVEDLSLSLQGTGRRETLGTRLLQDPTAPPSAKKRKSTDDSNSVYNG